LEFGKAFMKRIILVDGSGFLGQALAEHLQKSGYEVANFSRSPKRLRPGMPEIVWNACSLGIRARELEGATAVINLAGRWVHGRYTKPNHRSIAESRIHSTRVLGEALAQCKTPPSIWLNSSTATFYRHTLGPSWDESGEIGSTPEAKDEFSVKLARAWEKALEEAPTPDTRKVALRSAMVLGDGKSSVFPLLRRLTRLGLGGCLGSGRQSVSWIYQTDFCRAVEWLIKQGNFTGPVNLCAPNPLTNAAMKRTFRDVFRRPGGMPATHWMLEVGACAWRTETELVIKSRRLALSRRLESGFTFHFPFLRQAREDLKAGPEF